MPTVKINGSAEYDFEDYMAGGTFLFGLQFFKDDNYKIPDDISAWQFFFDIKSKPDCGWKNPTLETLSLGNGIAIATTNSIIVSKILESGAGMYDVSLRVIDGSGNIFTKIVGTLKISPKI